MKTYQETGYRFPQWSDWQKWAFNRLSAIARRGDEHSPARYAIHRLTACARNGAFVPHEFRERIETIIADNY